MQTVAACEKKTEIAVSQMMEHKQKVSDKMDEAIEKMSLQIAELEAP